MNDIFKHAGETQVHDREWRGSQSHKFTTNKNHIAGPKDNMNGNHPLFNMGSKVHFAHQGQKSQEQKWKASVGQCPGWDRQRPERMEGTKYMGVMDKKQDPNARFNAERKHADANQQSRPSECEDPIGRHCVPHVHNRKSINEYPVSKVMGSKRRTENMYDQRNGCGMTSLGDKIYKSPEFSTSFFQGGGLITGSTNANPKNTGGQGKNIDFYTDLKVDGPLNKGSKTYVQVTKAQNKALEVGDVSGLKDWERNILTEVDANYDPDDDSSDEEQIARRAESKASKQAAEPEVVAKAPAGKKK